jgi:hypothetical protein
MKQEAQQSDVRGKSDGPKQTPAQSTQQQTQLAPQPAFNPSQMASPGIAQTDGGIVADPAVEALVRFQRMQRALLGGDLREALKQSPVLNSNPTTQNPNQLPKALS